MLDVGLDLAHQLLVVVRHSLTSVRLIRTIIDAPNNNPARENQPNIGPIFLASSIAQSGQSCMSTVVTARASLFAKSVEMTWISYSPGVSNMSISTEKVPDEGHLRAIDWISLQTSKLVPPSQTPWTTLVWASVVVRLTLSSILMTGGIVSRTTLK